MRRGSSRATLPAPRRSTGRHTRCSTATPSPGRAPSRTVPRSRTGSGLPVALQAGLPTNPPGSATRPYRVRSSRRRSMSDTRGAPPHLARRWHSRPRGSGRASRRTVRSVSGATRPACGDVRGSGSPVAPRTDQGRAPGTGRTGCPDRPGASAGDRTRPAGQGQP